MKNNNKTIGKFGKKLLLSKFISNVVFMSILTVCLITILVVINLTNRNQERISQLNELVDNLYSSMLEQETGQRGYNLTGDNEFLQPYSEGSKNYQKSSDLLTEHSKYFPDLKSDIYKVIQQGFHWHDHYGKKLISATYIGSYPTRELFSNSKKALDDFRHTANLLMQQIEKKSEQENRINYSRILITLLVLFLTAFGASIINYLINVRFIKSAVKPIIELNESVSAYAKHDFSIPTPIYVKGNDELTELIGNIEVMRLELANTFTTLQKLADFDGLTKLFNRRYFDNYLAIEWKNAIVTSNPISLILFDIDYFKNYNDTYGHLKGDDCLSLIANALKELLDPSIGITARYGGEEFAMILINQSELDSVSIAERIRKTILNLKIPHEGSSISKYVTVSLGVSTLIPDHKMNPNHLISLADQALYASKLKGRNCVSS